MKLTGIVIADPPPRIMQWGGEGSAKEILLHCEVVQSDDSGQFHSIKQISFPIDYSQPCGVERHLIGKTLTLTIE
jgi:hypothetical protein